MGNMINFSWDIVNDSTFDRVWVYVEEEDAEDFLGECEEHGFVWISGQKPLEFIPQSFKCIQLSASGYMGYSSRKIDRGLHYIGSKQYVCDIDVAKLLLQEVTNE